MLRITERSFRSWVEKLAKDYGEPLTEIVRLIGCAIIGGELPAMIIGFDGDKEDQQQWLAGYFLMVVAAARRGGQTWEYTYSTIEGTLTDIMIKAADIECWQRRRTDGDADIGESKPPDLQSKRRELGAAIEEVSRELGERGRNCSCDAFDVAVWNRLGLPFDKNGKPPRGFGGRTIERRIVQARRSGQSDKLVGNVVQFVGNVGMTQQGD
jgi:hypothetical protein